MEASRSTALAGFSEYDHPRTARCIVARQRMGKSDPREDDKGENAKRRLHCGDGEGKREMTKRAEWFRAEKDV